MWKFNQSLLKSCSFAIPLLLAFVGLGTTLSVSIPARAQSTVRTNGNGTRVDVTLNRQPNESYETLVGRAQTAARNVLTRSFNQNPSAKRVSVTVVGENAGQVVPIMSLNVNRQTWATNPNIQRLATYFPNSRSLLGLATPASPNINVAQSPSTTTTNTRQIAPNNVRVLPNGTVVTGNGVQVLPNGTVVTNNGSTQVLPNGNIVPGNNLGGQNNNGIGTVSPNNPGNNNTNINGTTGFNDLGTTGLNGTNGTTGINGTNGTTGINGTNGTTGLNNLGTTGINGTNGTTGLNNLGTTGINGTNGTTGINGTNGTTSGQGGL